MMGAVFAMQGENGSIFNCVDKQPFEPHSLHVPLGNLTHISCRFRST
jgi:hypothetical protein